ncbi:hypothetical protein GCM10023116_15000 [Kistimonas scapharcae]|uniref:Uncharacterized protein n=1 Tax=Kistimonas scapharcae TaxID=1036133 RepID=A0ABP8UZZ3_9GAMM
MTDQNLQHMLNMVYSEIDSLHKEALSIQEDIYLQYYKNNQRSGFDNKARYSMRLKKSGFSFLIIWEDVRFFGTRGNRVRIVKQVSKGTSDKYTLKKFKNAAEWELPIIESAEKQFEKIRKSLKCLGTCHKQILTLASIQGVQVQTGKQSTGKSSLDVCQ